MKTQTQITQLSFNVNTLVWKIYFHIRGCNTIISVTSNEAESLIESIKQEDKDRITIEYSKDKSLVYYLIN
jgi:hypothetical protein